MGFLRRAGRILSIALAAVAALAALLYAASPWLLAGVAKQALSAHGLNIIRIEFGHPGVRALTVRRLDFSATRGGRVFEFRGNDLLVAYELAGLAAGQLRSLHLPDAHLRVTAAESATPATPAAALPLPAALHAAFPLQTLTVDQLAIDWSEPDSKPFSGTLRGSIENTAERLQSRWTLSERGRPLYEFNLDLASDGALTASLVRPEAPAAPLLHAAVTVTPRGTERLAFQGRVEARLQPLAPLLAPWLAWPQDVRGLDGRLTARWSGEMPASPGRLATGTRADGTVQLNATVAQVGDILQQGSLRADAGFSLRSQDIRFRLRENLRLAAHLNAARRTAAPPTPPAPEPFVRTPKPTVIRAPLGVTGQVTLRADDIRLSLAARTELVMDDIDTPDAHIPLVTARFPAGLDLRYRAERDTWSSTGPALLITAPTITPRLASVGTIETLAIAAQLDAGPLIPLPPLTVRHAGLSLLGGRLQTREFRIDGAQNSHTFTLDVEHLDLARVVALEQQQELEASGQLDGQLPIVLGPGGLRIESGRLRAAAPGGTIRYHASDSMRAMAESNPNLKLVLQALSNYRYEKLDVGVDYAENGDLDLRVALSGRNPDWNAGQPINLNLNVSENIPMLLRSLRIADDIGAEVEKRARGQGKARP